MVPKIFSHQLYLFQLENYEVDRYIKLLRVKGFFPGVSPLRKSLVWTAKARLLSLIAVCLQLVVVSLITLALKKFAGIELLADVVVWALLMYVALVGSFLFFIASSFLLFPMDWLWKKVVVAKARRKMRGLPGVHVIAVAGSYGKTTMKHVIAGMLDGKKQVRATPESYNTPMGVSRYIAGQVTPETEVLVVEMGEHYEGDIAYLCGITPPDSVVVTGINESHLERFGSMEKTIATIFEVVVHAKPNAYVYLNADDERVVEHYEQYVGSRKVFFYSEHSENSLCEIKSSEVQFSKDGHGFSFTLSDGTKQLGTFSTKLLGSYVIGNVIAAVQIAHRLGMTYSEMQRSLAEIIPVPHRLEPLFGQQDVLVIDDSYNGNPDGVREAIDVLAKFSSRRKLYITPGLVETGSRAQVVHTEIGKQLAGVADKVLLVKNSVTPFIAEGLGANGYKKNNILWYSSAQAAHDDLRNVLQPGDVIVFQNDWGDQYV